MQRFLSLALVLVTLALSPSHLQAEDLYPSKFKEFFKPGLGVSVRSLENSDGYSVRIFSDEVYSIAQDALKNKLSFDQLRAKYPALEQESQKFLKEQAAKKEGSDSGAEPLKQVLTTVTPLVTGRLGKVTHCGDDYLLIQYEDPSFGELSVIPFRSITRLQLPTNHDLKVRSSTLRLIEEPK